MDTISFTRQSESSVTRAESISVPTFVSLNAEKCQQIVAGLIEKSFAAKVRKLDVGSSVTISLDSILNDLLISASGRITREAVLDYLKSRKEEIAVLFLATKNVDAEKFASFNADQLVKIFSLIDSLIERVAISVSGRSSSAAQFSATADEISLIRSLPDFPEVFAAKFDEAISAQSLDFL